MLPPGAWAGKIPKAPLKEGSCRHQSDRSLTESIPVQTLMFFDRIYSCANIKRQLTAFTELCRENIQLNHEQKK